MYVRKTRDRWDIMTNYGHGWECECSEYSHSEARQTLKEYFANSAGRFSVRLEKRREKLEEKQK